MSRKNGKRKLINFVIFLILLSCVIYMIDNFNKKVKTSTVQEGEIEDKIRVNGIVFKDETIIKTKADGKVKFYRDEGERVKNGILIMEIYTDVNSQELNKELIQIEKAIEKLESLNYKVGEGISKETIKRTETDIQNAVFTNDIENLYNIINKVENVSDDFFDINVYENYSLDELYNFKKSVSNSIKSKRITYYANNAGLVSYKFDGLEDVYSFDKMKFFSANDMNILDTKKTDTKDTTSVENNQTIMKIINNFEYYVLIKVNNDKIEGIKENTYVKTRIMASEIQDIAYAYVEKINYGSEESVIVLKYTDYFYKYYDYRYLDVEIINNTYNGIILNSKAITTKDGITGVYVKDISNIVKFFPIRIIGEKNEIVIVFEGDKINEGARGIIDVNGVNYYTVKNYDKIILQPEKVYEGQILE